MAETAQNLEELRSGILELRVSVSAAPAEDAEEQEAGFELLGSFQLPEEGELPVADVEYTDLGADGTTQGFVSTGDAAFIEVDGQAYVLPADRIESLRGGSGGGDSPFADVQVGSWLKDPKLEEGEDLDGDEVDRVTAELEVVPALNDLFSMAQRFGGGAGFETIEDDEAERVENAVKSSHIEIISGAEDRLLRRLLIEVELGIDDDVGLREVLGPLAGAAFTLDMSISEPNQPIEVSEPSDPLPLEELVPEAG